MDFQNFLNRLRQFKRLDRLVIDECHVILNRKLGWRRNLQKLGNLIEKETQVVLLTATLPPIYERDLFETLYLPIEKVTQFRLSVNRSNIRYSVYHNQSQSDVLEKIRQKDTQYSIDRLIVFTRTVDEAKYIAKELDWPVYYSHSQYKEKTLQKFLDSNEKSQRIVGTSSLGLGLDAPNIRATIHINRPYSLQDYAQESGRAGRDNRNSEAILLLPSSTSQSNIDNRRSNKNTTEQEESIIDQYIASRCRRYILRSYLDIESENCLSSDIKCDICSPIDPSKSIFFIFIIYLLIIDIGYDSRAGFVSEIDENEDESQTESENESIQNSGIYYTLATY